jgi:hypothetical protein
MVNFSAITISVDDDISEVLIEDLKTAPRKFRKLYRTRINALAQTTLRKLQQPAPKVRYPIQWKSEKQRRFYFWSKGAGKGIPSKRTGALQAGWKVIDESDFTQGLFTIYNDATTRDFFTGAIVYYEQYVTGENQQPFHRNTGWIRSQDILADALVDAEDLIIETWAFVNGAK